MSQNYQILYFVPFLAFILIDVVSSEQWYFNVKIFGINKTAASQIEEAISKYPEILSYFDGPNAALVVGQNDWIQVKTVLKPFNVTYSVISDVKQCLHCGKELKEHDRSTRQNQFTSELILPRSPNQIFILEHAFYSLTGAKGCIVTPAPIPSRDSLLMPTDCLNKTPTVDDAWIFKSVERSNVLCDDAETEGASCYQYSVTISHFKFPEYVLIADNNTLFLSNDKQQNLTVHHVNGKDFLEIVSDEKGLPVKTAHHATNVYVGKLIGAELTITVKKLNGKVTQQPFLSFFTVKIHNNSPARAEVPMTVADRGKLKGKEYLRDMLTSNYIKAMIDSPDNISINLEAMNGFTYTVDESQRCFLGYSVITRSAPFLDIEFLMEIKYLISAGPDTVGEALGVNVDPVGFLYPRTIASSYLELKFQPIKQIQIWTPAAACRSVEEDLIPTCKDGDADTIESEKCTEEEKLVEFKRMIPEEMIFEESNPYEHLVSAEEDYSHELPLMQL